MEAPVEAQWDVKRPIYNARDRWCNVCMTSGGYLFETLAVSLDGLTVVASAKGCSTCEEEATPCPT